ncbi:MAG: hypothetical protein GY874_14955 [Desulfobacteraceae bacterium]|nr:hypothetical protein [Desulfobacteraceae bacterium]
MDDFVRTMIELLTDLRLVALLLDDRVLLSCVSLCTWGMGKNGFLAVFHLKMPISADKLTSTSLHAHFFLDTPTYC